MTAADRPARPGKPARHDDPDKLGRMARAVRELLEAAGIDVEGTELAETPANVARAFLEDYLDGYEADAAEILGGAYPVPPPAASKVTEMVLVRDITFHGLCPHHLLPFHGRAHVAYIPGKKLASLSSLARLVDVFAHRLEIQETVTRQIAEALDEHLDARGAAVILDSDQTCLTTRGVTRDGSRTVTEHFSGVFAESDALRAELRERLK